MIAMSAGETFSMAHLLDEFVNDFYRSEYFAPYIDL
jgi:hypothetical protein